MSRSTRPAALAVLLTAAVLGAAPARAQSLSSFTTTYKGGSGSCTSTYSIQGKQPLNAGAYPVFVYLVGTNEGYTHATALAAVDRMAARGFVAATVQYPNASFGSCSTLGGRAKCTFDAASATSAVSVLCARPSADCSKGVVVAGFSQGSVLATLAKNHDARVRAAYGLGLGVQYSFYDLRACVANGKRALPSSALRAVNGEADGFMGGTQASVRAQLQELTGRTCTGTSCLAGDGSGWYLVRHAEVSDGSAEHCYMRQGGCSATGVDQKWLSGTYDWSLDPNLAWLAKFATP